MGIVEMVLRTMVVVNAYYDAYVGDEDGYDAPEPPKFWLALGKWWAWAGNGLLVADDGETLYRYLASDMNDRDEMPEAWEYEERGGRSVPGWHKRNLARKAAKRAEKARAAELEAEYAHRCELIAALEVVDPGSEFWYSLHTTERLEGFLADFIKG